MTPHSAHIKRVSTAPPHQDIRRHHEDDSAAQRCAVSGCWAYFIARRTFELITVLVVDVLKFSTDIFLRKVQCSSEENNFFLRLKRSYESLNDINILNHTNNPHIALDD